MMDEQYSVILVYSTSHALKAERILKNEEIPCKLIPVPRHISSDCGSCIRVERASLNQVLRLLKAGRVGIEGTHDI